MTKVAAVSGGTPAVPEWTRSWLVVFDQPWEILEVAAMSLGFGDVLTTLDLCADAALLASLQPLHPKGQFYELGDSGSGRVCSPLGPRSKPGRPAPRAPRPDPSGGLPPPAGQIATSGGTSL